MQDEKYEDFATNTNIRSQVLNIGTLTRGLIELGLVIKYLWKHGCNQAMIGSWEVLTNKQYQFLKSLFTYLQGQFLSIIK